MRIHHLALAVLFCFALHISARAADPVLTLVAGAPAKDATPLAGEFHEPFAIDMDAKGNLYICELVGGRVLKLDPKGKLTHIAGVGPGKAFSGDGGPAIKAQFNGMHNLVVMPNGDLLIADTWNCCVRKIAAKTNIITTIVGTGTKGFSGDGGPASKANSGGIYSIALDAPRNRLFITDLDNRRIRVVNLATNIIDTYAGNGQKGIPTDGAAAKDSPLFDPRAVCVDSAGVVYILERGGHCLRSVDLQGRIYTVAGTGKKGPAITDCAALQATFNGPKHICCDASNNVIIADAENHVVCKYIPKEQRVVRLAGTGVKGTDGLNGPALKAQLNRPHGVFVAPNQTLYITDSWNHRVVKMSLSH